MRVSIITPFSKGAHFLTDCLDSIKEQTFQEIEWILVLDHAQENVEKLVEEYRNEFDIKLVSLHDSSTGVAAARNLGLSVAKGDYVYFLDSDDYFYKSDTLELLIQAATERDADLVYGRKVGSWFKRAVFLETYILPEQEMENEGDEEGENTDGAEEGDKGENIEENENGEALEEEGEEEEIDEETIKLREKAKACKSLVSVKKSMQNISILHMLIRRSLIEEHNIRFVEDFTFYSDLPFLLQVLEYGNSFVKEYHSLYIKRKHNDPVNFPALSQIKAGNKFHEFLSAYYEGIAKISKDGIVRDRIDRRMIRYYTKYFMKQLRRKKRNTWRTTYFEEMRKVVSGMDKELLKKLKRFNKKAIRALQKGDVNKSLRLINKRLGIRKFKKIIHNRREFFKYLYRHNFLKQSIKENWVLCESFLGKSYADSPKNIYEYIQKNYPGRFRFIWVIDKKTEIPYKHKEIKRFSLRYFYYLARCKYFVLNMRQPVWMQKRKESVLLETWHGTPLKKLVFDMEEVYSATPLYKYEVYRQTRQWDYLIAANEFSSKVFRSCFLYEKEMLEYGYPRNDILHRPDKEEVAKEIRKKLNIPEGKKTILYAPTWRDDEYYGKGQYKFTLKLDLHLLQEKLGNDYVILLRTHYFIADSLDVTGLENFAINLSKYDDIADIYLVSDICITDYSSVFFDYANLKRPILFYTYDLEKYRDMLRGFYIDIQTEVPGPLLFTSEEVVNAILNIDQVKKQYKQRYEEFYQRFCSWEKGYASQKIAEQVFDLK